MAATSRPGTTTSKIKTYLPDESSQQEIIAFASTVREIEEYLTLHSSQAALVDPEGHHRPIPTEIFRALEQVANALASGNGVSVAPHGMQMTTQQAADFLGISRPTLIKLLENGRIAYSLRGRHRRVILRDLVAYQNRFRIERGEALDEVARLGQESDVGNDGPPTIKRRPTS